jgi:hypothetical protein
MIDETRARLLAAKLMKSHAEDIEYQSICEMAQDLGLPVEETDEMIDRIDYWITHSEIAVIFEEGEDGVDQGISD